MFKFSVIYKWISAKLNCQPYWHSRLQLVCLNMFIFNNVIFFYSYNFFNFKNILSLFILLSQIPFHTVIKSLLCCLLFVWNWYFISVVLFMAYFSLAYCFIKSLLLLSSFYLSLNLVYLFMLIIFKKL